MSMNVTLHPADRRYPDDFFYSITSFELNSWCLDVLKDIIPHALPITMPVCIKWVDKEETVDADKIDNEATWLVEAKVLKKIKYYDPTWHPNNIAIGQAIEAYIHFLPDDWKVIVYYV